tara:strand:+ start:504 stop:635 length:132 start_codon:yes stop_codon:yes gene_type:complete
MFDIIALRGRTIDTKMMVMIVRHEGNYISLPIENIVFEKALLN